MGLILSSEMQRFVDELVKSGRFATPDDVIRAALVALMQQDDLASMSTEEIEGVYPGLRGKIAAGVADLNAGRVRDGEEVFDELDRVEELASKGGRKTA